MCPPTYTSVNGVTFVPDPCDPASGNGLLVTTDTGRFGFTPNGKMGDFVVDESKPSSLYTYQVTPSSDPGDVFPHIHIGQRRLLGHSESPVPDGIHADELGNV
jgi:hypothetical protein